MIPPRSPDYAWRVSLRQQLSQPRSYPIIAAGHYCLSTEGGTLIALDLMSGQSIWKRSLQPGSTAHALASDGTQLFVGAVDTRPIPLPGKVFFALDAHSGKEIWQHPTKAHSLSAAAVEDDMLYFIASDGQLYALELATGRQCWAVMHPAWGRAAPAVGAGGVYAGGRGMELVAYAAADGAEMWRFSAGGWFVNRMALSDGYLYAPCWDGHLYALEAQTGMLRWKLAGERGKEFTSPPVVADGRLFIGSRVYREAHGQQENGYALLAIRVEDGAELWRFHTQRHIFAAPTVAGNTLFCGCDDGSLYALDVASGVERWHLQAGSQIVTKPLVADDLTYIGERDGTISAVYWHPGRVVDVGPHIATPFEIAKKDQQFQERLETVDQEVITYQRELLNTYRRRLAVLIRQRAYVGEAYVAPSVVLDIDAIRLEIRRIKTTLRSLGVAVANWPDDEEPTRDRP